MPTILCAMPEGTYRRMMTPEREEVLRALGNVILCPRAHELSETEYGGFWERADGVPTGWGVRAPTPGILDLAANLRAARSGQCARERAQVPPVLPVEGLPVLPLVRSR